jgi:hypothetical protein
MDDKAEGARAEQSTGWGDVVTCAGGDAKLVPPAAFMVEALDALLNPSLLAFDAVGAAISP